MKTRNKTNKLQLLLLLFMVISNVVVDQAYTIQGKAMELVTS